MKYISIPVNANDNIYYVNAHSSDEPELCATPISEFIEYAKMMGRTIVDYDGHPMFLDEANLVGYFSEAKMYPLTTPPKSVLNNEFVLSNAVSVTETGEVVARARMINNEYNSDCH